MKHRIRHFFVFLFMIPLILLSSISVYGMEEKVYINSVSDFVEMSKQCTLDAYSKNKTFILTKDISLKNYENFSIPVFSGEFDGNGHTIRDFTIKKNQNPCGLFAIVQQTGIVKNVKITVSIEVSSENTGAIAGENYGSIDNCSVSGSICGKQNTGGIVGINAVSGTIKNCRMNGTVVGTKMTGGIAGSSLGTIESCQNQAYVNTTTSESNINIEDLDFSFDLPKINALDTSSSYYDTGGIAGYSSGIISNCTNTASIGYLHIGYNVGGIAGRSCGFITNCTNTAIISGRKDVGGICGQMEPYIAKSINKSTLGQLQDQLKELNSLLTQTLDDAQNESSILVSKCNQFINYLDQAANAANNIETNGNISGILSGSSQSSANGNVTVDPGDVEIEKDASISKEFSTILIPGVEINQGTVSSEKDVEVDLEQGSVDSSANASHFGEIDASSQLSITTNLSGLSSSISGMASVLRLLNNEIGNASVTLSNDLKAIQNQFNEISNTYLQLFDNPDNDYILDVSQEDIESISLGKISQTTNEGNVQSDFNAGGIIGSMAIEYELDPEDNIDFHIDEKLEANAVCVNCINTGNITTKYSYVGGIVGKMDLGYLLKNENYGSITSENADYVGGIAGQTDSTIDTCYAKCILSGRKKVGGIIGSGKDEDLSETKSCIHNCYSMVSIEKASEYIGAIAGEENGEFLSNYFISETLSGINGRSYEQKAQCVSYIELLENKDSFPESFLRLNLTFVLEDEIIKTVPFSYGDSFDENVYPVVTQKEGFYVEWDDVDLKNLTKDTIVKAQYQSYICALHSNDARKDGRFIFFVEGQFDLNDKLEIKTLSHPNSSFQKNEIIEECWKIVIPDDGQESHIIRYLSEKENESIYVKEKNKWKKVKTDQEGSYSVFSVDSLNSQIAIVSTSYICLFCIILDFILLVLIIVVLKFMHKKNHKTHKWIKNILLVFICIGTVFLQYFINDIKAYEIVKTYMGQDEYAFNITCDGKIGDETISYESLVYKTIIEDKDVILISKEDVNLYYCNGIIYLENGRAFKISNQFPDYSLVLSEVYRLYQLMDIEKEDDVYSIRCQGDKANALIGLLLSDEIDEFDVSSLEVDLKTKEDSLSELIFTGSGTLKNADSIQLNANLKVNNEKIKISSEVKKAIQKENPDNLIEMNEEVMYLIKSLYSLKQKEYLASDMKINIQCGPISINDAFILDCWNEEFVLFALEKEENILYFSKNGICDENGNFIENNQEIDVMALMNAMEQICMRANFDVNQINNLYTYSIFLDEDGMKSLVLSLHPEIKNMDFQYQSGSLQILVNDGSLETIEMVCEGYLPVLDIETSFEFQIHIHEDQKAMEMPEIVKEKLK